MKIEPKNLYELEFELKTKNLTQFIKDTLKQAAPENSDKIDIFFEAGIGLQPLNIITTDTVGTFGIEISSNGNIGLSFQTMILFYIMTEIFWDTYLNLSSKILFDVNEEKIELSEFSKGKMDAIEEILSWVEKERTIQECLKNVTNKQIYYSFIRLGNDRNGDVNDICVNDLYWLSLSAFILHEISHSRNSKISEDLSPKEQELCCDNFAFDVLTNNIQNFQLTEEEKFKGYTLQDVKVKRLIALELMFCIITKFFRDDVDSHPSSYIRIKNLINIYANEPEADYFSSSFFQFMCLGNNFWNVFASTLPLFLLIKNIDLSLLQRANTAKEFCMKNLELLKS